MLSQKTCFVCRESKPVEQFYRHPQMADGRLGKCKECTKKHVRANYSEKREQYSRYDKERQQNPTRRAKKIAYAKAHKARHPDRAKARQALHNAVRDGKIKRQPCCYCGASKRVQAHHADYSKPLEVTWACFKCHREREHGQKVTAIFS